MMNAPIREITFEALESLNAIHTLLKEEESIEEAESKMKNNQTDLNIQENEINDGFAPVLLFNDQTPKQLLLADKLKKQGGVIMKQNLPNAGVVAADTNSVYTTSDRNKKELESDDIDEASFTFYGEAIKGLALHNSQTNHPNKICHNEDSECSSTWNLEE